MAEKRRMYPIMNGPSVPYEVMVPHEHQAQRNHSQSIDRLAERGGLSPGEAWLVVNGLKLTCMETKGQWTEYERKWREFADRINLHYDTLDRYREALEFYAKGHTVEKDGYGSVAREALSQFAASRLQEEK